MSLWAAVAFFALSAEPSIPSPVDGVRSSSEQRQALAQKAAAGYRFRLPGQSAGKVAVQREPLLRWTNQVIREDDGARITNPPERSLVGRSITYGQKDVGGHH